MRRKRWSEEEEQTLILKYGEMARAGSLAKLKTREKKFEPIAAHVNALHHSLDNASFPWEWSWRDVSVKIQNMRHQYLGVKQKVRHAAGTPMLHSAGGLVGQTTTTTTDHGDDGDEYDWNEGITHWSNFLEYKQVFGDLELESSEPSTGDCSPAGTPRKGKRGRGGSAGELLSLAKLLQSVNGNSRLQGGEGGGSTLLGAGDLAGGGVSDLHLECLADEEFNDEHGSRKKRAKSGGGVEDAPMMKMGAGDDGGVSSRSQGSVLAFLGAYVTEQRERDAQREAREREREREQEEREAMRAVAEKEREQCRLERQRMREEGERRREREREQREWEREMVTRQRWEEERQRERAWEEKREREKLEWKERMAAMQLGHEVSVLQMQTQMVQTQQTVVSLLLSVFVRGCPVEETPGQRSALALQILHNLQQQQQQQQQQMQMQNVGAMFPSVGRKNGFHDASQLVLDGDMNLTGTH